MLPMKQMLKGQVSYNKNFPCLAPQASVTTKPLDRLLESIVFEISDEFYTNITVLTPHLTSLLI